MTSSTLNRFAPKFDTNRKRKSGLIPRPRGSGVGRSFTIWKEFELMQWTTLSASFDTKR